MREDPSNRRVIEALGVLGSADAYLPACSDRHDILTFGGEDVRWFGVALFMLAGLLRLRAGLRARAPLQRPCRDPADHRLVTDGIYRVIRHPSYLRLFINALGWGLAFRSGVGVAIAMLMLAVVFARIEAEERLLRDLLCAHSEACPLSLLSPAPGCLASAHPINLRSLSSPRNHAMIRSALMTVMTNAAIKAGRGLKRDFGEIGQLQVSMKGTGDFVSLADKRAEKTLYEELAKARPGYNFVMEEGGRIEGTDRSHTWHIDPLDATTNFLHAIPMFAISIALEREGQIVAGVIYNPADDDMYVTEKGQGAFGRNRRLRVAARTELSQALFGCGIPHLGKAAQHPRFKAELAAVMARVVNVRRMGCASLDLAYVAAGRFDAFWERGLNSWDIAAGTLLVREAGGFVSSADGEADFLETGSICCGNETMHRELLGLLKSVA